jgi:hypothetical protein
MNVRGMSLELPERPGGKMKHALLYIGVLLIAACGIEVEDWKAKKVARCNREKPEMLRTLASLESKDAYAEIYRIATTCRDVDPQIDDYINRAIHELKPETIFAKMSSQVHLAEAKKLMENPEQYSEARRHLSAIKPTEIEFPAAKRLQEEMARREKAAQLKLQADEKKAAMAEAAYRRGQGVEIGMTRERVLQSQWGRPQKVNTTTTARGTREQWVYGGGNYLYFENGILTTIQN